MQVHMRLRARQDPVGAGKADSLAVQFPEQDVDIAAFRRAAEIVSQ